MQCLARHATARKPCSEITRHFFHLKLKDHRLSDLILLYSPITRFIPQLLYRLLSALKNGQGATERREQGRSLQGIQLGESDFPRPPGRFTRHASREKKRCPGKQFPLSFSPV